jgi:hypothetical protein
MRQAKFCAKEAFQSLNCKDEKGSVELWVIKLILEFKQFNMTNRACIMAIEACAKAFNVDIENVPHFSFASQLYNHGKLIGVMEAVLALEINALEKEGEDNMCLIYDGHGVRKVQLENGVVVIKFKNGKYVRIALEPSLLASKEHEHIAKCLKEKIQNICRAQLYFDPQATLLSAIITNACSDAAEKGVIKFLESYFIDSRNNARDAGKNLEEVMETIIILCAHHGLSRNCFILFLVIFICLYIP